MSSSPVKDNEKGVTTAADEVELARMGYKQELKFVDISRAMLRANIFPLSQARAQSCAGTDNFKSPESIFRDVLFRILVFRSPLSAS